MKLDAKFTAAIQEIEATRGIPRARIIDALSQGVQAAYEKGNGPTANLEVEINLQSGLIEAYLNKHVVDVVTDPNIEIGLEEATQIDGGAEIGDGILLQADISKLGNLAIHTFKQRVKALIREAERDKVIDKYGNRLYEMVNCTILYTERGDVYVETPAPEKIEGIIPYKEQIPRERPQPGQRIKCILIEVRNVRKAPMLVFSRAHPDLLRELMANEIPEVRENNIEIVAIARDAGFRAKVAVRSRLPELDPVGSCIGSRGIRITAISHDLNDEKIDLVLYKEDPFEFIAEALSPAKVLSVEIFEDERRGVVVVPDDQISLAIGKGWRNVKLASKLTRFFLDVKSVTEVAAEKGTDPDDYEAGDEEEAVDDSDTYIDEDAAEEATADDSDTSVDEDAGEEATVDDSDTSVDEDAGEETSADDSDTSVDEDAGEEATADDSDTYVDEDAGEETSADDSDTSVDEDAGEETSADDSDTSVDEDAAVEEPPAEETGDNEPSDSEDASSEVPTGTAEGVSEELSVETDVPEGGEEG